MVHGLVLRNWLESICWFWAMGVCEKTISAGSKNLPPRASPQYRRRQHCMRACSDTAYGSACEGSFQCQGQERTIRVQICPVVVQNCSGRPVKYQNCHIRARMPVAPMSSVKTGTLGAIVSFVKCRCALLRCRFAPISAAGGGAYFNTLPCPNALLLIHRRMVCR